MKPALSTKERKAMLADLLSEYVFIITPFIFLVAIKLYAASWREILMAPDWSLVSCIIFGQISVRMSRAAIKHPNMDDRQFGFYSAKRFFLVAASLLFYFGMVAQPGIYLGVGQIGLFTLASIFHFKDGIASRILDSKSSS
ncbi:MULTISPECIES: hypothetical protein [Pseudomonas syringae group]|nr:MULTISPECIES: hypothetical protein [Pseudomonas syringae group]PYD08476.1 hypothetical protein DND62_26865 [Pseudomonas syringae pv. pisi]PYD24814.1 hypothetical protein DND58_26860 [Pseudomonas syringae pv. pisi]PYD26159.1 hypothetical protein DND67_25690 [Pseudomonas syringae pv. pisi]